MKAAVRLGLKTYTSLEFYLTLSIIDFLDLATEIAEVMRNGQ